MYLHSPLESGPAMSAPSLSQPPPRWRKLYEYAVLELDIAKIPQRLEAARNAIQNAIVELSSQGKNEDCKQLLDALNTLDDLLRMYQQPPQSSKQDRRGNFL